MIFKVEGKIVRVFDRQSGTSKAGKPWQKQEYLLETAEDTPQQICFTVFGDQAVEIMKAEVGDMVELAFEVVSREYQGRWFTNIDCKGLNRLGTEKTAKSAKNSKKEPKTALPGTVLPDFGPADDSSDLPF